MFDPSQIWTAAGVGFAISLLVSYPVYRSLLALKSRQTVSQFVPEHAAKQGTPTMGGIITGIGFLGACVWIALQSSSAGLSAWAIPFAYLTFALIGFVDDFVIPRLMKGKRGLGWMQKLSMQILFTLITVFMLGGSPSILWIGTFTFLVLFFSNAYNFADGMDWLAGLLLLAMIPAYVAIAMGTRSYELVLYLVALAAASVPFLALNKPKAKIFMGDVGALPIGAVLGVIVSVIAEPSLSAVSKGATVPTTGALFGLLLASLMMVAELVPVPLQILSVKLTGKRLFLMTPIHHGYQKRGWPESKVVLAFVVCQIALTFAAIEAAMVGDMAALTPVDRHANSVTGPVVR